MTQTALRKPSAGEVQRAGAREREGIGAHMRDRILLGNRLTQSHPLVLRLSAALLFAVSAWQANRNACLRCTVSDVPLALPDGTPIHARLYLPSMHPASLKASPGGAGAGEAEAALPAVIVCHGYLANLAFMEIPLAADLTHLGIGALFIDRRGQGRSGGTLWPVPQARQRLDDLEPDIAAAVAYLRSEPVIDCTRIALLGHSDGATAAIARASADWDIRATVAISASVAQWRFVNHVAPQNLLLLYGAADHFVLNDTDRTLISLSTRGYLVTPGRFGEFADGSARRLLRVPGRGHVDVFYDDLAREEVLKWLRASLWEADLLRSGTSPNTSIELPGRRTLWLVLGAAAILIALLSPAGKSGVRRKREPDGERQRALAKEQKGHHWTGIRARDSFYLLMLCGLWPAGLLLAPWLARQLAAVVPGQEGSVFAALLLGPAITLTLVGAPILHHRLAAGQDKGNVRSVLRSAMWGVASGAFFAAALYAAVRVLAMHHYNTALGPLRLVLLMAFVAVSLPAFAALEVWLQCASSEQPWAAASGLLLLAAITAGLSGHLFERMSVAPGYLLSAVLVVCACHRASGRAHRNASGLVLGTLTISWLGAVVCALY